MSLRTEIATPNRHEAAQYWLRRLEAKENGVGGTLLIVVARPDDEVIEIGGQLPRLRGVRLLHVTDGAPCNLLDAQAARFDRCQDYAAARRKELLAALRLVGIEATEAEELDIPDQGASLRLIELTQTLAQKFGCVSPRWS